MGNKNLIKASETRMPFFMDDFFKPWDGWFDKGLMGRMNTVPAVNITENKDDFKVAMAAPGIKKDDFSIDMEGNMLTISCEKEENKEEKDERFNRKEYNYSSFSRSFTLPDDINKEKIEARYEDGVLKLVLPKKEEAKKLIANKHITIK